MDFSLKKGRGTSHEKTVGENAGGFFDAGQFQLVALLLVGLCKIMFPSPDDTDLQMRRKLLMPAQQNY